ncbi:MAG: MBL fold metallo-hydrolase [Pseudomonadales bacterium]|nr:MBL fold metallo-hydrolase [Pseudomonadales bacterium]
MKICIIPVTPFQQNTSLIWSEKTKEAALIDPGGEIDRLLDAADEFGVNIVAIWLTHGHMDHAGAAAEIAERTGAPVIGPHENDQWLLDNLESQGANYGMLDARNVKPDRYLNDGDQLELGGMIFNVVHCPGHTPGHVVITQTDAKVAFVGDVLFQGSIGRTDFPRGNYEQLIESITQKLWPLGNDMQFVPGHGPSSTFGQERQHNTFVSDVALGN